MLSKIVPLGVPLLVLTCLSIAPVSSQSVLGNYSSAGIATDARPCAKIGMDVLRRAGTAVDAAVASLLCNGLYSAHSMGLGGGCFMTVYEGPGTRSSAAMVARTMAPAYAHPDMYVDNVGGSVIGPFAMAVPGMIKGLYEAKQRFGNPDVSWSSLFQPAIEMCREGIEVGFSLKSALDDKEVEIRNDPGLSSVFINPSTDAVWELGDLFTWPNLADTLERIAEFGGDELYTGVTAVNLVEDIRAAGGNLSMEDMATYHTAWSSPVSMDLGSSLTLLSVPPPSSGALIAYIFNVLKRYNVDEESPLFHHRVAETFKWVYATRTKLGDPGDEDIAGFIGELVSNITSDAWGQDTFMRINDTFTVNNASYYGADFYTPGKTGTAHLSVIAPDGGAVAATCTINTFFGNKFMSPSTGIILNNDMDDFSFPNITNSYGVPPSPNNFPKPGKRPLSAMTPTVVVDTVTGEARLAAGAAGGPIITTATAMVTMNNLWLGKDIKEAIDSPRIHHQLAPMELDYENWLDQASVDFLSSVGHVVSSTSQLASVQGVTKEGGRVYANADFRKDGGIDGF